MEGTPPLRVLKRAAAPGGARPEFITGLWLYTFAALAAYGINGTGAGQTVAIVVACGSSTIEADLAAFNSLYGLPSATLNIIHIVQAASPMTCHPGGDAVGWGFETSLDVEWVHALAPDAKIELVVAPSEYFSDFFTAVHYAAAFVAAPYRQYELGRP